MTVIQKKADNPIAHLTPEDIEQLGVELDAIRQDILDSRGADDAAYIRADDQDPARPRARQPRGAAVQRVPAGLGGRHGRPVGRQDPRQHGDRPQHPPRPVGLDARPEDPLHHLGVGHGLARRAVEAQPQPGAPHLHERRRQGQRPRLRHHARRRGPALDAVPPRPADLVLHQRHVLRVRHRGLRPRPRRGRSRRSRPRTRTSSAALKEVWTKIRKQVTKDYVAHPLLSIPTGSFLSTLAANFTANIVRNLWSNSVILCGHFPEGVETFEKRSIEGETKGEWYVRQMLGSRQHLRLQGAARHDRQPVPPGRAPPVPGPAVQPLRRDRAEGAGAVREVRPHLLHPPDAAAGLLRVAQGGPAQPPQRLDGDHQPQEPAPPAQDALGDVDQGPQGPSRRAGEADPDGPPDQEQEQEQAVRAA